MGPLDTLWHLLNFLAPAFGVGALAAAMVKLLWRRLLKGVPWLTLCLWAAAGAAIALSAGLVAFGRDGRVLTYLLVVVSSALALWWAGFAGKR